jgi:acyl-[acyl-carrier-protein]-phospholipid O-acyltransferase/long-chain-fatty-acid--[acyl-carrier-protein] ligase
MATLWFPLISGIGVVYHLNPTDAGQIGNLVSKYHVTILLSTPTFLNFYMRKCTPEQFKSLRIVLVGAEKLSNESARAFEEKYGVMPMEGYGATELSPIVSVNLPNRREAGQQITHKLGKIGLPLPGIAVKVVNHETMEELDADKEGLLLVKGQNVMTGYLDDPEKTKEVIRDGWYVTGDIAAIDSDGFLQITDRLSRFSKIGGEMVPHIKIEEEIQSFLKTEERKCVVTSVKDEKRGEQLAVIYQGDMNVDEVWTKLSESGMPKLWIPKKDAFYKMDALPILGSGKIDLVAIRKMAEEKSKIL